MAKAFTEQEANVILQNLKASAGMELAVATVRGLFLAVSHRENIGPLYPQVLDTLVQGSC